MVSISPGDERRHGRALAGPRAVGHDGHRAALLAQIIYEDEHFASCVTALVRLHMGQHFHRQGAEGRRGASLGPLGKWIAAKRDLRSNLARRLHGQSKRYRPCITESQLPDFALSISPANSERFAAGRANLDKEALVIPPIVVQINAPFPGGQVAAATIWLLSFMIGISWIP